MKAPVGRRVADHDGRGARGRALDEGDERRELAVGQSARSSCVASARCRAGSDQADGRRSPPGRSEGQVAQGDAGQRRGEAPASVAGAGPTAPARPTAASTTKLSRRARSQVSSPAAASPLGDGAGQAQIQHLWVDRQRDGVSEPSRGDAAGAQQRRERTPDERRPAPPRARGRERTPPRMPGPRCGAARAPASACASTRPRTRPQAPARRPGLAAAPGPETRARRTSPGRASVRRRGRGSRCASLARHHMRPRHRGRDAVMLWVSSRAGPWRPPWDRVREDRVTTARRWLSQPGLVAATLAAAQEVRQGAVVGVYAERCAACHGEAARGRAVEEPARRRVEVRRRRREPHGVDPRRPPRRRACRPSAR